MVYYDNATIQYGYCFELYQGDWKWVAGFTQGDLNEAGKMFPMNIIEDK
jgi:hypothetical protein